MKHNNDTTVQTRYTRSPLSLAAAEPGPGNGTLHYYGSGADLVTCVACENAMKKANNHLAGSLTYPIK